MSQDASQKFSTSVQQWRIRLRLLEESLRELLTEVDKRAQAIDRFQQRVESERLDHDTPNDLEADYDALRKGQFELEKRVRHVLREESERML